MTATLETITDVLDFLIETGLIQRVGRDAARVRIDDVTGGNLNRIFVARGPLGGLAIKQAPPFINILGEGAPLNPDRILAEARAYRKMEEVEPNLVPRIYLVDPESHILVMEDLSSFKVARDYAVLELDSSKSKKEMRSGKLNYALLGYKVGHFIGSLTRATSRQTLTEAQFSKLIKEYDNPDLCEVTVQYVLTEPYETTLEKRWASELDKDITSLQADSKVKTAVSRVKRVFLNANQALIHGDLHSGSIMVKPPLSRAEELEVRIFDPEFCFVGPIGMDLGLFWANMRIASYAADSIGEGALATERESAIQMSISAFKESWEKMPHPSLPMSLIVSQGWAFAAVEMIRRVAGIAKALDLESLPAHARVEASKNVLNDARKILISANL